MTTSVSASYAELGKTPQQLCAERTRRILDATQLKQPDRVPIIVRFNFMLAALAKTTKLDLYEHPEKAKAALINAALRFQPDAAQGLFGSPEPSRALGDVMTRWPGYGLDANGSFQYHEEEYMKAEDYDAFLADPVDWAIRVYLPRTCKELEGLKELPPLAQILGGFYGVVFSLLGPLASPGVRRAAQALAKASDAHARWLENQGELVKSMEAAGFPMLPFENCGLNAPFDFMSDALRAMRGIFLDMHRCPDKLLAAEDIVARTQTDYAIAACRAMGNPYVFFPLHRGSDEFISLEKFERFYWPQLKAMLLELIEAGLIPMVFYEGTWNKRLKYLAELPKGKTIGYFHRTDLFKAKEVIGDVMCIEGGMPVSLLVGGAVQEVREHTKRLCQEVGKGGGFIMATSTGELEGANPDLVQAWVDATREFGAY
jgi:hypothetical protein